MLFKTDEDIELIREAGAILAGCFTLLGLEAKVGVKTLDLDGLAERYIRDLGGVPALKGYRLFPAALSISINDEVINGVPDGYRLREGDLVSFDCSVAFQGRLADSALTIGIGEITAQSERLLSAGREALDRGLAQARPGNSIASISSEISRVVQEKGMALVPGLVGHGIGFELHEFPMVPNNTLEDSGILLETGMVLAIEPILTHSAEELVVQRGSWTLKTRSGGPAVHFEHTVAVTSAGPLILSLV